METKKLYLFTVSYPYDFAKEANFILPEIQRWKDQYDEVIFVPSIIKGEFDSSAIHDQCRVDESLAKAFAEGNRWKWMFHWNFWRLFGQVVFQVWSVSPFKMSLYVNGVFFVIRMLISQRFIKQRELKAGVDAYTFWNTFITAALADLKGYQGKRWTRVHGDDFYPERQGGLIYFERKTYQNLDKIVFVSHLAKDYWAMRHPNLSTSTEVSYLGVKVPSDWKVAPVMPSRSPLKIFSCSGLNKVKRIALCNELVSHWNYAHPNQTIEWHHLGATAEEISDWIGSKTCAIGHGWMSQTQVLDWILKENPMCLISVSESEGFPVSMQEAMLCGVPIMAAANGGMVEAVNICKGWMLSTLPTMEEFDERISAIMALSDEEILKHRQFVLDIANAHFLR